MRKLVKYLLITVGVLIVLPLAAIIIITASFDPNEYKPQLIQLVKDKKHRTLSIPGEINLTFFPRLGVELGKVSLSERVSSEEFASINNARIAVALLPLLSKNIVIDHVMLDGLSARFQRFKDGRTNIDSLLMDENQSGQKKSQQDAAAPIDFAIAGVSITNANILFDDHKEGRSFNISNFNLETGRIANGIPSRIALTAEIKGNNPQIAANVSFRSGFSFDLENQRYVITGLDTEVKGIFSDITDIMVKATGNIDLAPAIKRFGLDDVKMEGSARQGDRALSASFSVPQLAMADNSIRSGPVKANARMSQGNQIITASFAQPGFEGAAKTFKLPAVAVDASISQEGLDAKVRISGEMTGDIEKLLFASPQLTLSLDGKQGSDVISGTLTSPLSVDLHAKLFELAKIRSAFTLPNPAGGAIKMTANGNANADIGGEKASAAFKGNFDQSNFDLRAGVSGFSQPGINFDIAIDKIDADRYRKQQAPAEQTASRGPEQPIDISALRSLKAQGSIRIGSLKAANIKLANLKAELRAGEGKAEFRLAEARLYGGSVSGSLGAFATTPPRFSVRQNLAGVDIGPLLKDALDMDPVEGKGNVTLDLDAQGASVSQLKKGANGNANIALRDGSVRGINIAKTLRNARSGIDALKGKQQVQTGTGSGSEKTDFTELTGSFVITNGVIRNNDLTAKSPLLRIGGSGEINLAEDRLDYLVKAAVVSSLKGQDGADLESLRGVTVPVRLSGPLAAIDWKIDFKSLLSAQTEQKIEAKKEALKTKANDAINEKKAQATEQVKEKLKEGLKGLLLK